MLKTKGQLKKDESTFFWGGMLFKRICTIIFALSALASPSVFADFVVLEFGPGTLMKGMLGPNADVLERTLLGQYTAGRVALKCKGSGWVAVARESNFVPGRGYNPNATAMGVACSSGGSFSKERIIAAAVNECAKRQGINCQTHVYFYYDNGRDYPQTLRVTEANVDSSSGNVIEIVGDTDHFPWY
jgi:hypothetical protein